MVLENIGQPLRQAQLPASTPGRAEVLVRVHACAVCRTDLHVIDGELNQSKLPLIPGHEIVGRVEERGDGVERFKIGDRVGVPWIGWTCGKCVYCLTGQENLCDQAKFTGYTLDGGYADYALANERFCFPIPELYSDIEAAPLLCAGLIGYRSLVKAGDGKRVGIYGFGAAAHIITQVAVYQRREIYAFTRHGGEKG
jgi:propanol-preferring alcohol dehydrogenase